MVTTDVSRDGRTCLALLSAPLGVFLTNQARQGHDEIFAQVALCIMLFAV